MGSNIIKVLFSNSIVASIGLISSLLLPRFLNIDDYALYQTFLLYLSYIAVLHLGFPTGLSIKYAGKQFNEINLSQFKSELLLQLFIPIIFSILSILLFAQFNNKMIIYISIMIFLYCFLGGFIYLLQAFNQFNLYSIIHVILSAGPLAFPIIYFILTGVLNADICIKSYIYIYLFVFILVILFNYKLLRGIKANKIFSHENFSTERIGFTFLLGNYINSLFHSIDKQFVKWFCLLNEFAYYSFAITMQNTMTIFITAVAQPLFPYIASGAFKEKKQFLNVKRLLMILGTLSGFAYYGCAIIVTYFLPSYIESLNIIKIYFIVFPAMAVINGLYINLYKIKKMTHKYIKDLCIFFFTAFCLNYLAIYLKMSYYGIAIATIVVNYLWFLYGHFVFEEFDLNIKDILFLILFCIGFLLITNIDLLILGIFLYLLFDISLCYLFFTKEINMILKIIKIKLVK